MLLDSSPESVAARLAWLRAAYTPMTQAQARALLEIAPPPKPFVQAVAERLAELRALTKLTRHLQRRLK